MCYDRKIHDFILTNCAKRANGTAVWLNGLTDTLVANKFGYKENTIAHYRRKVVGPLYHRIDSPIIKEPTEQSRDYVALDRGGNVYQRVVQLEDEIAKLRNRYTVLETKYEEFFNGKWTITMRRAV